MKRNRRRVAGSWHLVARAFRAARITAVGVLAVFGAWRGLAWAKAHPYFAVREIDVQGHGPLDAKTILAWSGLANGMSIWDVAPPAAEASLLSHPRIRAALVERELPGRVRVRVEEREPVALLFGEPIAMVADDGVVFPAAEGEALAALPYVSGFAGKDPASAPVAGRLRDVARLAVAWRAHAQWPAISEIRPDAEDLLVFAAGTPLAVRFAGPADANDLDRLGTVLELWRGREAGLAAIDLSTDGEAIVKLRPSKPAAAARGIAKAPARPRTPARGIVPAADRGARAPSKTPRGSST